MLNNKFSNMFFVREKNKLPQLEAYCEYCILNNHKITRDYPTALGNLLSTDINSLILYTFILD